MSDRLSVRLRARDLNDLDLIRRYLVDTGMLDCDVPEATVIRYALRVAVDVIQGRRQPVRPAGENR